MEDFEKYLNELNVIVGELENGKLTLAESIEKYKRAMELSNYLKDMLEKAKSAVISKTE